MSARTSLRFAFGAGVLAAIAGAASACANVPDKDRETVVIEPDYPAYLNNVDKYLNRRCGTLDCHGQPGRGYRIYGREGFRLYSVDAGGDAGDLVSGKQATLEQESRANFQAIVALEPEELNRVMASQASDEALKRWVFLRKPLKLERHKGGPAMALDDVGYRCVVAWLRIPVVRPDGTFIEPKDRPPMSERAIADCNEAFTFP